ncbi:MAG TPA: hypothetical protein VGE07_07010 [Herpetosiphonaceae bacterium]
MYSVPPIPPDPAARWPRTLFLAPRRRATDRRLLIVRLALVAIQVVIFWGIDLWVSTWALLALTWAALVLGPLAELLPATWQRPASALRVGQAVLWVVVLGGYVALRILR